MKTLVKMLVFILVLYVSFCVLVFFLQKNLIFYPTKNVYDPPNDVNIEEVFFDTADGVKLHAWYLDNAADKTVLFFHGNAGNLSHRQKQIEVFAGLGLNALIFDYRGYGKSEGSIKKESDVRTDAEAALDYLVQQKKIELNNLIIWGRSIGAAIALDFAQDKDVFAVIVESTFSSLDEMASKHFWFLPTKLLSKFHFKSDEKIKNIYSKILIIHSRDDEMIPLSHGESLLQAANEPKLFLEISGTHNGGFLQSYGIYLKTLREFLGS